MNPHCKVYPNISLSISARFFRFKYIGMHKSENVEIMAKLAISVIHFEMYFRCEGRNLNKALFIVVKGLGIDFS